MKALVFNGPKDIRYESFEDPKMTSPNGAIVQVKSCSICGSDLHIYHGDKIGRLDYSTTHAKFCVGHEFIGEVVDVGSQTHTFKVGDKVLSAGGTGCGSCHLCLSGQALQCHQLTAFGIDPHLNGGQAEYVFIPNADATLFNCDHLSDEHALLLTDALATAQYGINAAGIEPGDVVVISGLGPIGLLAIELAFIQGAARVYGIDPVATRRNHAEQLGAVALESGKPALARIIEDTRGKGADKLFEASGAAAAIQMAPKMLRIMGTLSLIGLPQTGAAIDVAQILFRNITVKAGTARVQDEWRQLNSLLESGRLKAAGLFTHKFDLTDGAQAYQLFDSRDDGMIKSMIHVR